MTPEQFAYWLQGFAEMNSEGPTEEQWKIIKDHLQLVFKKETPVYALKYPEGVRDFRYPNNFPEITC